MIPLVKPIIGKEEKDAVLAVLDSGNIAQGQKVKEFEEQFAAMCKAKHAVAVNNGTAALHTALASLGIKKGDEVITSPFTFIASSNTILMQQAKPVFVDIEEEFFHIDPEKIQDAVTDKTKAIVPIDLYGQIYDYDAVKEIADKHDLFIVEDGCQSAGAELNGVKAGMFGDAGCFSFYATKNMTTGEGGMLVTNDGNVAELARRFRHHGQGENRYEYFELGYNYRMTDFQAAIGIAQLKKLNKFNEQRIGNAAFLTKELRKFKEITVPKVRKDGKHVFHQYTIRVDTQLREKIMANLKEKGIGFGVYYPKPLHLTKFYSAFGYKKGDFPTAERVSTEVLSLPVQPLLSKEELGKIVNVIGDCL